MAVHAAPDGDTIAHHRGLDAAVVGLRSVRRPPLVAWVASRVGGWQFTWVVTGACSVARPAAGAHAGGPGRKETIRSDTALKTPRRGRDDEVPSNTTERTFIMRPWIRRTLIGVFGASPPLQRLRRRHLPATGWSPLSEADAMRLKERMVDKVAKKLDLDETQKAEQSSPPTADRVQEQRKALAGPNGEARAEGIGAVAGPRFRPRQGAGPARAEDAGRGRQRPQLVAALGDFWDSLKPEQQAKLREFMDRRHGWRG